MLRRLLDRFRPRSTDDQPSTASDPRDYAQEREDRRVAQMSEEDKAWGEASRERDRELRETREQDQTSQENG